MLDEEEPAAGYVPLSCLIYLAVKQGFPVSVMIPKFIEFLLLKQSRNSRFII